ncbi:HEAT repeat domain-containing protein [Streptacidiphilus sp. ASG 303]|uniref:HEAT repeat domain-containing protein n=1 Tax=Streptacidiphilus sp. ASG 303 TaxID=2896847 RepID=UPI001E3F0114|nr:HEAT repeat domain-containing protein [Streptacidiphilus sp. ASG 303]MCD0483727.1 HEAT repeat domain-containing protein [Streptacidiphilus sp. ASG 303]
MFEPDIAPSATLLGLLQRGRGDGTLHALAAERPDALAALDACVTCDPRRDWRTESRSLYYARLYSELEAPLDGIEAHLFHPEDLAAGGTGVPAAGTGGAGSGPDESRTGLALSVLGHLAAYGRRDALGLLRRYTASGANWAWALDELALRDDDAALMRLAPAVLDRFPAGPEGDAALRAAVRDAYEPRPWRLWAAAHPRIAAAGEQAPFDLWQRQLNRTSAAPGWGAAEVLAWADRAAEDDPAVPARDAVRRRAAAAARCLAAVAGPDDRPLLVDAARCGAEGARRAALRHLLDRDDPAVPDLVELAAVDPDRRIVEAALELVGLMRGPAAVGHARRWADPATGGADSALGEAAARLLADAGDERDAPLVTDALRRWIAARGADGDGLGCLVDGAGRLGAAGAVAALRYVYAETVSSQLRGRAARALAATDPYFPAGPAVECLWDCEESTRELAARHVATTGDARVLERLRRLAADPAEEAEVHAAVRGRLTSAPR